MVANQIKLHADFEEGDLVLRADLLQNGYFLSDDEVRISAVDIGVAAGLIVKTDGAMPNSWPMHSPVLPKEKE